MKNLWTAKEDEVLKARAAERWSASRIGEALGRTKNAIIGRANRTGVKLNGEPYHTDEAARSADERPAPKPARPRHGKNVIRLVIPTVKAAGPLQTTFMRTVHVERGPRLSAISNERMLIADYLAKHGARRFERGQSGSYDAIKRYLEDRGYTVSGGWQGKHKINSGRGRPRALTWAEVIAFVDELRASEGLPTLRRQA